MISIRKTSDELDRMEHLIRAVAESYGNAVWSTAQYAIELNPADLQIFREHLTALRAHIEAAATPEDWRMIQASFRGELRDYRDNSVEQLSRLRGEIGEAVKAMQIFADSVASTGADHHQELKLALSDLGKAVGTQDITDVRSTVHSTIQSVEASAERMQKAHQLVIAQLRDEIRVLHNQIEAASKAAFIDPATGVWNRRKIDADIQRLIANSEPFSILLVCVRNLKLLDQRYSRTAVEGGMRALLQRFATLLGNDGMIGRWDEENFAAILSVTSADAIRLSRETAKRLSGTYAVHENGLSHHIAFQTATGVIDRSGVDVATFQQRLMQMSDALVNA